VKVYISVDMEGVAGIADWEQCLAGGDDYALGRDLVLGEVNAAIDGAVAAGADEILVNDSHSVMRNLPPAALGARASYLSGRFKPLYMMEGLEGGFDAVFMVSYHGSIGHERAILSHTYNPSAIWEVKLNGIVTGEAGLNALVAQHHGVPVALITGDQATADEAQAFMPGIEAVVVKRSVSRFAAESLHPARACELIRAGARAAIERLGELKPPTIAVPPTIEVTFLTADMAEAATALRGVERTETRTVTFMSGDPLQAYRTFVTVVTLTRGLGE